MNNVKRQREATIAPDFVDKNVVHLQYVQVKYYINILTDSTLFLFCYINTYKLYILI